jgi:hypothetical protein
VQTIGRQPRRAPDGAVVRYERHRPEQTTLYRVLQQHAAIVFAQTEDAAGANRPQLVKDEFDAFLECGILAHGSLRLRCADCGHNERVAFTCKRRGLCPSCGARRMAQTAAYLIHHAIPTTHIGMRRSAREASCRVHASCLRSSDRWPTPGLPDTHLQEPFR